MTISFLTRSLDLPDARTLPELITYDLSHIFNVSLTLWSVINIPISSFANTLIIFCISITDIGSIPANGSSSKRNLGFKANARAISTLLLSQPDNCIPLVFMNLLKSNLFIRCSRISDF